MAEKSDGVGPIRDERKPSEWGIAWKVVLIIIGLLLLGSLLSYCIAASVAGGTNECEHVLPGDIGGVTDPDLPFEVTCP